MPRTPAELRADVLREVQHAIAVLARASAALVHGDYVRAGRLLAGAGALIVGAARSVLVLEFGDPGEDQRKRGVG